MKKIPRFLCALLLLFFSVVATAQTGPLPDSTEGDYKITNFPFKSGETTLSTLTIHYTTFGKPLKDASGKTTNAILIMHGTTGNGHNFINQLFAGHLFEPGQLLDATRYYIILPDAIGHGNSSKPSNTGLHMRFPRYTYDDMVLADYRLLTEHLGINHLRLCMGTSMGAMHTWVWGYTYPNFMDALMPLASLPVAIAGRNRMLRKMAIDAIEADPARQDAEQLLSNMMASYLKTIDANDFIYAVDASREYDPSTYLSKIKAPLFAVNSADDEVNPPELGIMEKEIKNVVKGRYILLPITDQTSGHGTHSNPTVWGDYLQQLLALSK